MLKGRKVERECLRGGWEGEDLTFLMFFKSSDLGGLDVILNKILG